MLNDLTLNVVVSDADTGEVLEDLIVPPGNEVVFANEPLYVSHVQEYSNGTKVITLKKRAKKDSE